MLTPNPVPAVTVRSTRSGRTSAAGSGRAASASLSLSLSWHRTRACPGRAALPTVARSSLRMRQYTKPFYSLAVRVCVRVEAYTLSAWRSAKGSSDECEAAATDVHAQFLGIGLEFTQELRLDNQPLETLVLVRVLVQPKEQKRREEKRKDKLDVLILQRWRSVRAHRPGTCSSAAKIASASDTENSFLPPPLLTPHLSKKKRKSCCTLFLKHSRPA